ncbi:MAG TPA: phosphatase PAP2 family protein [Rectinemataceae bacterium]|nr:phosphatase PAP2 family protein [Rectinemataceae bacterium]
MDPILAWGMDVIRAVQRIESPALTQLALGIGAFGSAYFYLLALPLLYWCVDRRRGIRIGLLFFVSSFLNGWIKDATMESRPYTVDPSVGRAVETSPSFPSFHAQSSALFWGALASSFRRPLAWLPAVFIPALIGFTRVFLGVHYPSDVLAGWAFGFGLVLLDRAFGDRIERLVVRQRERMQLALVAVVALAMNAIDMKDTGIAGVFFGFGVGVVLMPRIAPFSVHGSLGQRALRFLVGAAGLVILYLGPRLLVGSIESLDPALVRFIRYGIVGLWASLGAPWLFLKLALSETEAEST